MALQQADAVAQTPGYCHRSTANRPETQRSGIVKLTDSL